MHVDAWLTPQSELPLIDVPGVRPLRLGHYGVVGTAWVSYESGSVLEYHELLVAVLARRGWRVVLTIVAIWVDSVASRDGGRALWGIPKSVGTFGVGPNGYAARTEGRVLAETTVRAGRALAGRWPLRASIVQRHAGTALRSPVRATTRLRRHRSTWTVSAGSPLAFVRGRRPRLGLTLHDFDMIFAAREPTPADRTV